MKILLLCVFLVFSLAANQSIAQYFVVYPTPVTVINTCCGTTYHHRVVHKHYIVHRHYKRIHYAPRCGARLYYREYSPCYDLSAIYRWVTYDGRTLDDVDP